MGPTGTDRAGRRGVSPVVGGGLLLGIVVALGVLASVLVFGLAETGPASPESRIVIEDQNGCTARLVHEQGDTLDGDRLRLRGTAEAAPLQGQRLGAGEAVEVQPTDDRVTVVWTARDDDTSFVLERLDAPERPASWLCGHGTLYAGESGDLTVVDTAEETLSTLAIPGTVDALGPATADLTGDGRTDIPYVDDAGRVNVTGPSNETTTLASDVDIPGAVESQQTRLGVGRWNGSEPSVFFVNQNHDTLYRVAGPDAAPVEVATPGNGVQAVVGPVDVDGDDARELVFADASQQLRALQPDGTTSALEDGQLGANDGVGAGTPLDVDDDGTHVVAAVDGSNDLKLVGDSTTDGGEGTRTLATGVARKSPVAVADVDGDGELEVAFVSTDSGKLKYVDDLGGSETVTLLTDASGSPIQRSDETGVV